ncbi:MAG TPA: YggS family pyridoxal phosphate-dependent enzyme [Pedomonas sp.]|uniref:YggS family pyridoxal phosphate-dependent enzyme n=1 Tax=Pedomonas sp. TaxID=2976421 RepID=UPI002F3E4433
MNTTDTPLSDAAQRLRDIHSRMDKAARLVDRAPGQARLIAVSKTFGPEAIEPLLEAGQRLFGENRVQEAQGKWPALKENYPDVELHLVGQLQSNKAEDAVELFDAIHSVDRSSLVQALAKAMDKTGKRPSCFIQVNIGEEEQKGGVALEALPALLEEAQSLNLPVVGLMCVPPADKEPSPYFGLLAKLAKRHGLPRLSMGMSSDFETAVSLGATEIRVGTALFGTR